MSPKALTRSALLYKHTEIASAEQRMDALLIALDNINQRLRARPSEKLQNHQSRGGLPPLKLLAVEK